MVPTPMHCARALVIQYCMIIGIIAVILMLYDTDIIGIIAHRACYWNYCYDTHAV